jgi:hypothetical protein
MHVSVPLKRIGVFSSAYKIISVLELKERGKLRCAEYWLSCRDVITVDGEDILDVPFFIDGAWLHSSVYINSRSSAFCQQRLHMSCTRIHHYMTRRMVCGAQCHEIK